VLTYCYSAQFFLPVPRVSFVRVISGTKHAGFAVRNIQLAAAIG